MENVDDMPAGRRINELVAARVMGWTFTPYRKRGVMWGWKNERGCWDNLPNYSMIFAAALYVLERLDVWRVEKSDLGLPPYSAFVARHGGEHSSKMLTAEAKGETAALAICRAALKVYQVKVAAV